MSDPIDALDVIQTAAADVAAARARDAIARAAAGELLGPADMQAIWKISPTHFRRLKRLRLFDSFLVHPPIGVKCYSGILVTRYLAGELIDTPAPFRFKRGGR